MSLRAVGVAILLSALGLSGCGSFQGGSVGSGSLGGGSSAGGANSGAEEPRSTPTTPDGRPVLTTGEQDRGSIFDLFNAGDADVLFNVNKYLWNASLSTLNFLPIQSADPYTGLIVTGFGRAPGSATPYRATIRINSIDLEASSLEVSVFSQSGLASAQTQRLIEDAILTRARELRIRDLGR